MNQTLQAFITSTGSGVVTLATHANPDARIRVVSAILNGAGTASTITFQDGDTAISPVFNIGVNALTILQPNNNGWFSTSAGNDLKINFGASGLAILINYIITYE